MMKVERKIASSETTKRQETEWIRIEWFDRKGGIANDPHGEPNDMHPNENHRSAEARNSIG
jgi:hypothetical protein